MVGRLHGKAALVTGGGSGIGRATVLAFAREGARVAIADVSEDGGQETARLVREAGGEAVFIRTDVSRSAEVEAMLGVAVEAFGRLDCAFNNAGISGLGVSFHEYAEADWDRAIDVNLKGVWLCMKFEIVQMLRQGYGSIVNNSSVYGLVGARFAPEYRASKHGLIGLTKSAAIEYAQSGIRVNAVCPGPIRTPMVANAIAQMPQMEAFYIANTPLGRLGNPEEVAEAVVWLCSDAASFITGVALPVDGGWVAR